MRKFLKILLYIICGILLLLMIVIAVLQTRWGKDFVRKKVVDYLNGKLKTEVVIQSLNYHIPKNVELKGVLVLDQQKDTLLAVQHLKLDLNMLALVFKKIAVRDLLLEGVNAHVYRSIPDSTFNYDYIIRAFAGTDTAKKESEAVDTASSSLTFDIHKIELRHIRLRYDDSSGGTLFSLNLGQLLLRPTKIDPDKNKFEARDFTVSNLSAVFIMDTSRLSPPPEDTTPASDFQLAVENIRLNNIHFKMVDRPDSMYMHYAVGHLQTTLKHFGLTGQLVTLDDLLLENADGTIVMGKPKYPEVETADTTDTTENNWQVLVNNVTINQVNFAMDDNTQPHLQTGVDYAHLHIQDFFFNADDVRYSPDTITADLKHLTLKEQSGLNIMELRSRIFYCTTGARLDDLYLLTPNSLLQKKITVTYPSLDALSKEMDKMHLDIALNNSKVGINDLLFFLPADQQKQLLPYKNQFFYLTADMKGYLNDLLINKLYLSGLSGTIVDINGRLNGLPDADKLHYDLALKQVKTTAKDIAPFLPDSLKQQLRLPEWMAMTGKIKGGIEDYFPDILFHSADGDATVKGFLMMSPGEGKEKYELALTTNELNVGKIIRQDSVLGKISLNARAKGQSFDPKSMNTTFDAEIQSADAMNYGYKNISLAGHIADQLAQVKSSSADPNIAFQLTGSADLSNEYPAVKADLDLKNADLYALKLSSDTLRLKGDMVADFASVNPDYPSGSFYWSNGQVMLPGTSMPLDTILFISNPTADSAQDIYLNVSNVLQDSLSGHFPLTQLGNALLAHINKHYRLQDTLIPSISNYDLKMKGLITYNPLLNHLLPELKPFDTIRLDAGMSPDTLALNVKIPRLVYGTNQLDSGAVWIKENPDTFRYYAGLKQYQTESFQLWYPSLRGLIRQDSIYALANIKDSAYKNQFTLGGSLTQEQDSNITHFRLFKGLRFDYDIWKVNPGNQIVFGPDGFFIQNLDISKNDQSVSVSSQQPQAQSPLDISIKSFRLANITRMISKDTLIADGILDVNGTLDLSDSFPKTDLTASIKALKAFDQEVGQIDVKAKNENENDYQIALALSGQGNDVQLKGNYYLEPVNGNNFNFDLSINPLSLKSVQGLTFGALKNSFGALMGQLNIQGTAERPEITGMLRTNQLETTVSMLNASFKMPDEKIVFDKRTINFDHFHIEDRNGNDATIDGSVRTRDYRNYFLNLDFDARKWQPLHSTKKDNPEYYGDLILSADISVRGAATAPDVEGNLTIHDSTKLYYAMLDEGPGIVEHEGIVKFVNGPDTTAWDTTATKHKRRVRFSTNTQMNVNVAIEKGAVFNVLMDPASGDMLQVGGEANLNTFLAPDGSIGLTGRYELNKGYYELNYNFLRRKFKIQEGSVITLAGDPLDAEADITAAYEANIAPYDLVANQANSDELVYYKQRLPFQVLLKIKGKVMKPEITFDIVLPENQAGMVSSDVANLVQAKLAEMRTNTSEMNKQVFAVLILGRFISDDPFNSGTGNGTERLVRQSVSKFLSEQLNQMASGLIPGMELNVGLNSSEDYSTGTKQNRTDLDVSASKQFFNNRLKVTVGNNFELEGQAAKQQTTSGIPGNLSIDYMLTQDGKYIIRAYRSNEMQNIVDGYVTETGLNFRLSLEYNRFKYLFINRKKYFRKLRAKRKAEQEAKEDEAADKVSLKTNKNGFTK